MTTVERLVLDFGLYALLVAVATVVLRRAKGGVSYQKDTGSNQDKINGSPIEAFTHFPKPPEGMNLYVDRLPTSVKLTGVRIISPAHNTGERRNYYFLATPFCGLIGLAFVDWTVHLLTAFYQIIVSHGDTGDVLQKWAILSFFILLIGGSTLLLALVSGWILVVASRMTPERIAWELEISEDRWRITIDRPDSEPSTEVRELIPSHVTQIGVDVGGRVYCVEITKRKGQEAITRIELTPMLSKTEAAWLEEALRSMLNLAPAYL